jgi:glyoxylase-like metal-dependent hydrolase (beta-lactamase superfamily II)
MEMVRLHALDHGLVHGVDAEMIDEHGVSQRITIVWPDRCFLVEHPAGYMLWDTGLPEPDLLSDPWSRSDWKLEITSPLLPWLAGFGLAPDDISFLGISHLHIDHAGNANQFASSTILIGAREHAAGFGPDAERFYHPQDYAALRTSETILIGDRHDVFGDGTVIIHAGPGHTLGHQMLALHPPGKQPLLLVADAAYSADDFAHRRIGGWSADLPEAFRTLDRIERLAEATNARLLFHHALDLTLDTA